MGIMTGIGRRHAGVQGIHVEDFETVRLEPWYTLLALLLGAGGGYLFFMGGVAFEAGRRTW